jgi:hypothetical protein
LKKKMKINIGFSIEKFLKKNLKKDGRLENEWRTKIY